MNKFKIPISYNHLDKSEKCEDLLLSDEQINSSFEFALDWSKDEKIQILNKKILELSYKQRFDLVKNFNLKISDRKIKDIKAEIKTEIEKEKKLQILMGAKNAEKYLPDALKSIEDTFKGIDWIFITLDDCSSDRTNYILKNHKSSCKKRIHLTNQTPSENVSHVKNKLLQLAMINKEEYQYFYMVDADDLVLPDALKMFNEIKKSDSDIILCSHQIVREDGMMDLLNASNFYNKSFGFGTWATIVKLDSIGDNGLLFRSNHFEHEDALAYVRMYKNNKKFLIKDELTVYRHYLRVGSVSMNSDKNLRASKFMKFQKSKEDILNPKYIKSFCTIGTTECWKETVLMIKTLRKLYDEPIIICGDEKVKSELKNNKIKNYIFKDISLDGVGEPNWSIKAYHNNRALSLKYLPIKYALDQFENTMFIDSDFLILERFDEPYDGEISLCRHFRKNNGDLVFDDQFGKYNSGLIFCKDDYFPEWWRNQMLKDSYFTDQECLSRCLNFFAVNEMSKNNNVGFWRVYGDFLYDKSINKIKESLDIKIINGEIFIEGYKLNNFHVHMFMDDKLNLWQEFKNFVLYCLENSNNKWIIDEINKLK